MFKVGDLVLINDKSYNDDFCNGKIGPVLHVDEKTCNIEVKNVPFYICCWKRDLVLLKSNLATILYA